MTAIESGAGRSPSGSTICARSIFVPFGPTATQCSDGLDTDADMQRNLRRQRRISSQLGNCTLCSLISNVQASSIEPVARTVGAAPRIGPALCRASAVTAPRVICLTAFGVPTGRVKTGQLLYVEKTALIGCFASTHSCTTQNRTKLCKSSAVSRLADMMQMRQLFAAAKFRLSFRNSFWSAGHHTPRLRVRMRQLSVPPSPSRQASPLSRHSSAMSRWRHSVGADRQSARWMGGLGATSHLCPRSSGEGVIV